MNTVAEIRWELVRCVDCGHEHVRERDHFTTALPCTVCRGAKEILPMIAVPSASSALSIEDAAGTLRYAATRSRALADAAQHSPGQHERHKGRAEAFEEAVDIVTAIDPLRTDGGEATA